MRKLWLALPLIIAACTRAGTMVPANEVAAQTGPIDAHFKAYGMGHGEAWGAFANGAQISGNYLLYREQNVLSYNADILFVVFGKGPVRQAAAEKIKETPVWSPGVVDLTATNGLTAHCELINNNMDGHGKGACLFSNGAYYSLVY